MLRFSIHYFLLFAMIAAAGPYFQLLLRARGFDKAQIGLLLGLAAGAGLLGPLLAGHLADRLGKRRTVLTICLVAYAGLFVPIAMTSSFAVAVVLVLGIGLVARTSVPLTDAMAASELANPAEQYGPTRVWGSIGYVAALVVIAAFSLVDEDSSASIMRAVLATVGLAIISSQLLPDRHRPDHVSAIPKGTPAGFDAVFWLFVAAAACHRFAMTSHYSFFVLFLRESMGMEKAAWTWAIGATVEIPLMFFSGVLIKRFGIVRILMLAMLLVSVRLLVYSAAGTVGPVLAVQLVHGLTFATYHAATIEFVRRKIAAPRRAWAMALYMSLGGALPGLVASSLGGYISDRFGYATMYLSYAFVPLIGVGLLAFGLRRFGSVPGAPEESG
jgi:PPP family 3-phenylpropionic acid transporter